MSLYSTKQVLPVVLSYDEFDSPLNALIAYARPRDPRDLAGNPIPFNGYLFRVLTSQGPHAPGGSKNYIVDGKMTVGFAFVAYPAEYRSTGVMTFIVDESGTVFEKDLGPDTTKLAETVTAYDPDSTWHQAEQSQKGSFLCHALHSLVQGRFQPSLSWRSLSI